METLRHKFEAPMKKCTTSTFQITSMEKLISVSVHVLFDSYSEIATVYKEIS